MKMKNTNTHTNTFPEKADIRFDQMPKNYREHDDEKYKDKYKGLLGEGCHQVW